MDRAYRVLLPAIAGLACALTSCAGDGASVAEVGRTHCGEGWRAARAGTRTLLVHNGDSAPVDVTVTDASGGTVFGELEGVGPGVTRPLRVSLGAGTYALRCRPAYGAFGDRADAIDGRPAGFRDPNFRGFHRVERGLWHGASAASLRGPADRLAADVRALRDGFPREEIDPGDLGLRAHEILEDTLRFELTGESDQGSGTELATAAANLDGTRAVLAPLRPLLKDRLPGSAEIDVWLDRASRLLHAQHRHGEWTPLDRLGTIERERVNGAVGELVERLASVATVAAVRRTP